MKYEIRIAAGAAREIAKLPEQAAGQVSEIIDSLAGDPRPSGARKLESIPDCYRVRSGVYRIVYTIHDNVLMVGVVTVGHRKDVYKGLRNKAKRRVQ